MNTLDLLRDAEAAEGKYLSLVASESLLYPWVRRALASELQTRTVEGLPGHRYFPTTAALDALEEEARVRIRSLFGLAWSDVRPASATSANMSVATAFSDSPRRMVSLSMEAGGHLSHGHPGSFIGRYWTVRQYGVRPVDGFPDLDRLEDLLNKLQPQLVLSGGSALPREFPFDAVGNLARQYGALHWADISHTAGLIAAALHKPVSHCADVVTLGTQKTLLGPRAGVLLGRGPLGQRLSRGVFPGVSGAHSMSRVAAVGTCAEFAATPEFVTVMKRVRLFADLFADAFRARGLELIHGGTESHLVLVSFEGTRTTGADAERGLHELGIQVNRNLTAYSRVHALRLGTISIAQSRLRPPEVAQLADHVAAYLVALATGDPSRSQASSLRELVREFRRTGRLSLDLADPGGWVSDENIPAQHAKRSRNSTIFDPTRDIRTFGSDVLVLPKPETSTRVDSWLRTERIQVVIPFRDEMSTLASVVRYSKSAAPSSRVIVVASGVGGDSNEVCRVARSLGGTVLDLEQWLAKSANWIALRKCLGVGEESLPGKGWSLLAGILESMKEPVPHMFFLDADLEDISTYDPIRRLAHGVVGGGARHAVVATPNRANEPVHAAIAALSSVLPSPSERTAAEQLRLLVHPLAGERYVALPVVRTWPVATGYGVELLWSLSSVMRAVEISQVANDIRRDTPNSYLKNQTMLLECARFLVAAASKGLARSTVPLEVFRAFNLSERSGGECAVIERDEPLRMHLVPVRRDLVLPPPDILLSNGLFRIPPT